MPDIYRYTALALAVIDLMLWSIWALRSHRHRGYAWVPITWLIAALLFWIWTIFIRPPGEQTVLANWLSATLQYLAFILLGGAVLILLRDKK